MVTSLSIGTGGLGRFGNQCYTIAGVIGIAEKSGQPFAFPEWYNRDNALFGGSVDRMEDYFENPLPRVNGEQFQDIPYFWGYKEMILSQGHWNIFAHLQSPKYFEHCIDKVKHYFKMKDEPEQNDYCAIHYRAGDYIDDPNAYHPRCSKEYYQQAIAMFPEGTKFNVFSDDRIEATKIFYDLCEFHFPMGSYLEDFKFMKKHKSFIISNSTFSSFAATIAEHPEKKVVSPRRWFGTQAGDMNWNDGYQKDWIVI